MSDKVWKWDYKLSHELFSEAVYSYRQAIKENQKHKLHMHCKNGIFAAITSLEAFINETLIYKLKLDSEDLKKYNFTKKLEILIANFSFEEEYYKKYLVYKDIRHNYLIHHKRDDHLYVDKINPYSLLETIEAVQEIIARISFNNSKINYPYWISGLNFVNPRVNNDIDLTSDDIEFWRHIRMSVIDNSSLIVFDSMMSSIDYPANWEKYENLHLYIWKLLFKHDFDFNIEEKNVRFPHMPYLSCKYWE